MNTVADKLELLLNTKRDLCAAIAQKSSTPPPSNATFRDYVALVDSIEVAAYSSQSIILVNDGYNPRECWYDTARSTGTARYVSSASVYPSSRTTVSDMLVGGMIMIPYSGRYMVYKNEQFEGAQQDRDYLIVSTWQEPKHIILLPKISGLLVTFE